MAGRPLALGAVEEGWRKGPWTAEEDKLLIEYVSFHGEGRWNTVARLVGLKRNGKSCRLRWVNYLRPDLKRGQITPEEEKIIIELHARWGNRWSTIARSLPGRTDNEIKNYWRTHYKKNEKPSYNSGKARSRPLRCQRQEQHQQVLEQTNQVDMKKTTSQFEEGDYKVSSLAAQVRPEMILVYPTSEEQCLTTTLRGNGPFPETTLSDDGLWGGLWNFYDDYGSSFGNISITSKAMEQNQMDYFYPGYFNQLS